MGRDSVNWNKKWKNGLNERKVEKILQQIVKEQTPCIAACGLAKKVVDCEGDGPEMQLIQAHGSDEDADMDDKHNQTYHLFKCQMTDDKDGQKVEASPATEEELLEAVDHIDTLLGHIRQCGLVTRPLTSFGGFMAGYMSDCNTGMNPMWLGLAVATVLFQLYKLNQMTKWLTNTKVEGRPINRFILSLEGLDDFRVQCAGAVLDCFGRFTRANFVGYICKCGAGPIDDALIKSTETSLFSFLTPLLVPIGFQGLAVLSFLVGPLLIQNAFAAYCWFRKGGVAFTLQRARIRAEQGRDAEHEFLRENDYNVPDTKAERKKYCPPLDLADILDDVGALAVWANCTPIYKVLDKASIPVDLDDAQDVKRLWGRVKTLTLVTASHCIPDSMWQMALQVNFLAFTYPAIDISLKVQLVLNIVLCGVDVMGGATDLITANRRLPFFVGLYLAIMGAVPLIRLAFVFICTSSIVDLFTLSCVAPDNLGNRSYVGTASGFMPGF